MISREDRNYWTRYVMTKIDEKIKALCSEVDHIGLARQTAKTRCLITADAVREYSEYELLMSNKEELQRKIDDMDRQLGVMSSSLKAKFDKVYGDVGRYYDAEGALDHIVSKNLNGALAGGTPDQKHIYELMKRKDDIEFELMQETSPKMIVEAVKKIIDAL